HERCRCRKPPFSMRKKALSKVCSNCESESLKRIHHLKSAGRFSFWNENENSEVRNSDATGSRFMRAFNNVPKIYSEACRDPDSCFERGISEATLDVANHLFR